MEGDTIRASGTNTLVDMWLGDRVRSICITRDAIAANVGFARAESMTEDERCKFVRANLTLVLGAAKSVLRDAGSSGSTIVLDGNALAGGDSAGEDRRKSDRRKGNRRSLTRPKESVATGERRRSDRRQSERRRAARPKASA